MNKTRFADVMVPVVDAFLVPLVAPAAILLKAVRRAGLHRMAACRSVLLKIGVLPIRNHYYEPFLATLRDPPEKERHLPGIDWNEPEQLSLLSAMQYAPELAGLKASSSDHTEYRLNNGSFLSGDAEYLYQIIRVKKPRRIVEIGSGFSTLMARRAVLKNLEEGIECKHVCIEPYENRWLERSGVTVVRKRLEDADRQLFAELGENDLLFIDSSHIIRPQGEVLIEYLEILPILSQGVIVHVHDIFTPRDYPAEWMTRHFRLWNEQYLLEAFLSQNVAWKIIGAVNLLKHRHFDALQRVCPYLTPDREPGSFYMQKV